MLCLHYTIFLMQLSIVRNLLLTGCLDWYPREWIISHRCSWMAVYVFCCNTQSKSHSDLLDISRLSLFYQLPNCNLFTPHVLFIYGETPLVNYGPRSYFRHIPITYLLYLHCLLYMHTLLFSTRYAHNICFKQTGEIDNRIVIWEQSTWPCCVQVPHCFWPKTSQQVSLNGALVGVLLSQSTSTSVVIVCSSPEQ
jgi:hypothetical protein